MVNLQDDAYRRIFESVNDALLLYELTGRAVAVNPAACRLFGYTEAAIRQLHTEALIHPDSRPTFAGFGDTIAAGQPFHARARLMRQDGTSFYAEVRGTPFPLSGRPGALAIIRDITQEVEAQELLDRHVAEQTRELQILLEISHSLTLTLDLESLLAQILDQLVEVVPYHGATVLVAEGDYLVPRAYRGPAPAAEVLSARFPINEVNSQHILNSHQSLIVTDMQRDNATRAQANPAAREIFETSFRYVRGWMATPIHIRGRPVGILVVHHRKPGAFTEAQARKARAFANQAAVAIENARLYESRQRRAEQFRIISEVGQRITSILALDALLSQTVQLIQAAFGYYHIHIGLIEDGYVTFKASAGVWWGEPACRCCSQRLKVGEEGLSGRVAASGHAILVPDVTRDPRYVHVAPDQRGSNLVLPLTVKEEVIGVLDVESEETNAFDADDLIVLQLLANQIATAIDNARLYEQAQQLAALQERQKLARELHDSVSQALYGIALGARTARVQLTRDPAQAAEPLDYVLSLAEAGLAEMRALIFELRPESLANEGLVAALNKQVAALRGRHPFEIVATLAAEPEVSLDVKEAFFRVAQEALHNVVKHAGARHVALSLAMANGQLSLEIRDDGRGFDPGASFPGHLGLQSMRERIDRLGGNLVIASTPGLGTRIQATVDDPGHPPGP